MKRIGFDNERYLRTQSEHIQERIARFGGKLYLEFGGKLFDDYHAARVLPGFQPDSKVRMLLHMKDDVEIVVVINASDIEKNKVRGDLGITYDLDVLRLIDAFRGIGLYVGSVVIAQYNAQPAAEAFQKRLESLGLRVYRHYPIAGYPSNIPLIVSDEGYGRNEYIETQRSLVVVTAPGPGSGKMATCLSQLYHEYKLGIKAGYAKFETFPIWNLPLKHPVNLAYEAATADLNDVNMIDPFHLEADGITTVNYNRDVEVFPVLNAIFDKIAGGSPYKSPTDMGVNMAGSCIIDDEAVCDASKQEIIACALKKAEATGMPAAAIELPDGRVVSGKTSALLGASAAALLNALKVLGGIQKDIHLISPIIIEPIQNLKTKHLGNHNPRLHTDEILVALSICAANNPTAELAMAQLPKLRGCEAHSTVILSQVDSTTFRKLGVNLTCEPKYQTKKLFHG